MEKQTHYKLRKVKKKWITVAVTTATATLAGLSATVSADVVTSTDSANQTIAVQSEGEIQDSTVSENQNQNISASQNVASTAEVPETAQPEQISQTVADVNNQTAEQTNQASDSNTVVNLSDNSKQIQVSEINNESQITSDSNKAVQQSTAVAPNGIIESQFAKRVNNVVKKLVVNNNANVNAFAETGTATAAASTDVYDTNNRAHSNSANDFEQVDNYLTADSWYRPKAILKDGKVWTDSTETDFRPILISWWPDTTTEVNYINYMNKYFGKTQTYTNQSSASDLKKAAQAVQVNIEEKISQVKSTDWLRTVMSDFVKSQTIWNIDSESPEPNTNKVNFQRGALLYVNGSLTPQADSSYRLLNRTPSNQKGTSNYLGGYEFLLANDVDNSNPVVQAEQLNWLHYLMNFGSIYANDADANFDGIRIDAVDNIDADLLQIAGEYFKATYDVDQNDANANQHIAILEGWDQNDAAYTVKHGGSQITMDDKFRRALLSVLTSSSGERGDLSLLINNSLVNRQNNSTSNSATPNYTFVRAHDSEVQTVIAKIIKEFNSESDGYVVTEAELKKAFEIYNADQKKTIKSYTQYNIPAAYALLLTNKDTIPRVYYGDLFTDDGQYMATKSPYYDAIDTLLKARVKYVAGGQSMAVVKLSPTNRSLNNQILTSVRYGSGAMTVTDTGDSNTRTQGMLVLESNNPKLGMSYRDKLTVKMGAAHKNQAYRPLLLTTANGITTYQSDSAASKFIKYTDSQGNLTFTSEDINGYSNPQVSGYLAVWVPVGASDTQDARVSASSSKTSDGQVFHSNAALDSHLIYEGFSNFQAFATDTSQYTNVVIAKNTDLFKSWGVTDFEMAPQYVSSTDGTFLDSIILNGYAFTDRYDLGISKANKYGTAEDLVKAIKNLHGAGIKVLADWVPDQIYSLPEKEVVTATRVDVYGNKVSGATIDKTLYVANTRGGGKYQAQYGGAFLEELKSKSKYAKLFSTNQISTGKAIDPSVKITEWSAKYFNGTNILGRGSGYVLKDSASGTYLHVGDTVDLPKALLSDSTTTNGQSGAGQKADSDDSSLTYYYPDGRQAKDAFVKIDDKNYYYGSDGKQYRDNYYFIGNDWYYFDSKGVMAVGLVTINGASQYFEQDGKQVKGRFVTGNDKKVRYFDPNSGNLVKQRFVTDGSGNWYYLGSDGSAVTGQQTINGQKLYFKANGQQAKGVFVTIDNKIRYYDANSGEMITNRFVTDGSGNWYYLGSDGSAVTGQQTINGQRLYFKANGQQVKGEFITVDNKLRYYDSNSGEMITNRYMRYNGRYVYFDIQGIGRYFWWN
ncbi:glycoside hydrolase family 70 protein [Streptococcus dentiloxodontae]